ncbi:MAG: endonuclease/exonuclease/phosphatase family protein [Chloroflexi bacterium]|nr:endonuclease/exonuclease/phosphatase family protein [Chloroflexota bacterium]
MPRRRCSLSGSSRTLTAALFLAGLALLTLLAVARFVHRPRPWPVELLDTFAFYAFSPLLGVSLVAIVRRSRLLLAQALVAGVFFGQQFGWLFLPRVVQAEPSSTQIRILTSNVLWRSTDAAPLASVIESTSPDVVVLQELTGEFADELAQRLASTCPHRAISSLDDRNDGRCVFSRLPISRARAFRFSRQGNEQQQLQLMVNGRSVALFNVHLESPRLRVENPPGPVPRMLTDLATGPRDRDLAQLVSRVREVSTPYVLAGDLNLAAGSRPYRSFPMDWRDTFAERGWGLGHTFPMSRARFTGAVALPFPAVRIDSGLSSHAVVPVSARVLPNDGSDHLSLLAELRLSHSWVTPPLRTAVDPSPELLRSVAVCPARGGRRL